MRYPASEKLEIIHLVEQSHLPVRRTLAKLGIQPAQFYRWYDRFQTGGPEALENKSPRPKRVWNRIPDAIRERIIQLALDEPELSPHKRTRGRPSPKSISGEPSATVKGIWDVDLTFDVGTARHLFDFERPGGSWHTTHFSRHPLSISVQGKRIEIISQYQYEGTNLCYKFIGEMDSGEGLMRGEVEIGSTGQSAIGPINMKEYGTAHWVAIRRNKDAKGV